MKWENLIKIAIKNIIKNRMRSFLTMLGIVIGVAAVIAMVSVGRGTQAEIKDQISSLGTNLIIVMPGSAHTQGVRLGAGTLNRLTLDDVKRLEKEARLLQNVSPIIRTGAQVIAGGKNWFTSILGVSPNYLSIREWSLERGNFFTDRDVKIRNKVAVLGKSVADEIFPELNPIGARIRIRNVPFKVIGVLSEKGQSAMGQQDQDDVILAPSTTVLYRLKNRRNVDVIMASAVSTEMMNHAQEEIRLLIRKKHRLMEGKDDDFTIRNQTDIVQTATTVTRMLTLLLGSIAGVSLIVGGIGIMNIMLVSVTERTHEIGIRLAIGARAGDILIQFLIEAIIISLIGGIIGIFLGIGLGYALGYFAGMNILVDPIIIFVSFLFSGALGVFFGFYPAKKASNLNPIDALRYE